MSESQADPFDFDAVVHDSQAHIRAYIAGLGVPRHDVDDVAQCGEIADEGQRLHAVAEHVGPEAQ